MARTLVVDQRSGSDGFKTIQSAVDQAKAGDTIVIREGTYREDIDLKSSGTADAKITLRAAEGAQVDIKGSKILEGFEKTGSDGVWKAAGWDERTWSWDKRWTDDNPDNDKGDARTKANNMMFVEGEVLTEVPKLGPNDSLKPGQFYMDKQSDGTYDVLVRLSDNSDPNDTTVELATDRNAAELLNTRGQDHWNIEGIDFSQAANAQQHFGAVRVASAGDNKSDAITFSDIDIYHAASAGLSLGGGGSGHIVEFSRLNNNGQTGLHGTGIEDTVVRYTEMSGNNRFEGKQYNPGWEAGGAKFTRTDGLVFDNVLAEDNWGSGIWYDWTNVNAVVTNSVAAGNKHGLHFEASGSAAIYNNLFLDNVNQGPNTGNVGQGIFFSSSGGSEIFNNTLAGNQRHGILVGEPSAGVRGNDRDGYWGPQDNDVYRNVVVTSTTDRYAAGISVTTGLKDANKEYKDTGKTKAELLDENLHIDIDLDQLNRTDANVYSQGIEGGRLLNRATTIDGAQKIFKNGVAAETSVKGDPGFVNAAANDYNLTDDSIAHSLRAGANPEVAGGDALIGRWEMNGIEGGDSLANTSYRRDADGVENGASVTEGIAGKALRLDVDDTAVLSGTSDEQLLTNEGTISLWIRPDTTDSVGRIFSAGSGPGDIRASITEEGHLTVAAGNAFGSGRSGTIFDAELTPGEWNHVAVRWSEDGRVEVLFEGEVVGSGRSSIPIGGGADQDIVLGSDVRRGFDGSIDEVLVYDRKLEDFEVWSLRDEPDAIATFDDVSQLPDDRPTKRPSEPTKVAEPTPAPVAGDAPEPGQAQSSPSIATYLVDASTDEVIAEITDGATIDVGKADPSNLSILVESEDGRVESVALSVDGEGRVENLVPYALFGDQNGGGDINGGLIELGDRRLDITLYDEDRAGGDALGSVSLDFTLRAARDASPVTLSDDGSARRVIEVGEGSHELDRDIVIEGFDMNSSGNERTFDTLVLTMKGDTFRIDTDAELIDLVALAEGPKDTDLSAFRDGDDLVIDFEFGGSITLEGIAEQLDRNALDAALEGQGTVGLVA